MNFCHHAFNFATHFAIVLDQKHLVEGDIAGIHRDKDSNNYVRRDATSISSLKWPKTGNFVLVPYTTTNLRKLHILVRCCIYRCALSVMVSVYHLPGLESLAKPCRNCIQLRNSLCIADR